MVAFYKGMEFQLKSIKYCIIIVYYVNVALSDECRRYIKVDVILNVETVEIWSESLKKGCQNVRTVEVQDLLSLKTKYKERRIINSVPVTSTFPLYHM